MWSLSSVTTIFWHVFHYNKKWARYDQTSSRRLRVIVKLYNSFSTLSHKRHVLRKNGNESKMWNIGSSTTFVWNVFHLNKKWARYDQTSSRRLSVIVKLYNSFSKLSHNGHVLWNNVIENKMCVLIFTTTFVCNVFHYNKKWARYDQTPSLRLRVIFKLYNSFSTLSHNRHVLRKNGTESKMWRLSSSTTLVRNIFHYNKKWARYVQTSTSRLTSRTTQTRLWNIKIASFSLIFSEKEMLINRVQDFGIHNFAVIYEEQLMAHIQYNKNHDIET
jgi:hypothetical protein